MVDKKDITLSNGQTVTVDYLQFGEKGKDYLIGILAFDFAQYPEGFGVGGEVEITRLGKLQEQQRFKVDTLQRLILAAGWDWKQFPNPEVILISRKSKIVVN